MSAPLIEGVTFDMARVRRDLHAHPELAFGEHRTAGLVAGSLEALGIEVHRGVGGTGIVGVLRAGSSTRRIGLRADMDALAVQEANEFSHRSRISGVMHACGHDGHVAMLLGAAARLAGSRNFDGTVVFIFQPAEEGAGGATAMIRDGLFEVFPVDEIYALHNWPALPAGDFAVRAGVMMASSDELQIEIHGKGGHAAMPHETVDAVVTAAHVIVGLQSLVSRKIDPLDSVALSFTQVWAGNTFNVIPDTVSLRGTLRCLSPETRNNLERWIEECATSIAAAHVATATVRLIPNASATINAAAAARAAGDVARNLVGEAHVHPDVRPSMASEDFGEMLRRVDGAYVWIGQGGSEEGRCLHSPTYDFNDGILELGVQFLASLVPARMPTPTCRSAEASSERTIAPPPSI